LEKRKRSRDGGFLQSHGEGTLGPPPTEEARGPPKLTGLLAKLGGLTSGGGEGEMVNTFPENDPSKKTTVHHQNQGWGNLPKNKGVRLKFPNL